MAHEAQNAGFTRNLGLLDVIMVGVAAMIGGAIFVLVGPGMGEAGPALMIAFLLNGIITIFTAFTYAELSSALPDTGGGYRWVREGMPRPNAFLSGWMSWFAHTIAGSLYAVAFASFFAHLLDMAGILESSDMVEKGFAAMAVVIFTFINVRGTAPTSKVGNAITITQITIIGVLIVAALFAMAFANPTWPSNFSDFFPHGISGLVIAMGLTFIAFEGYEVIAQTGNELKNPKKNIPRAIFISLFVVIAIYILFTFSFIGGLSSDKVGQPSWEFIGSFGELGILEAAKNFMPFGAMIVLAGGFVSTLAALNATTYSSSRVSYAMGTHYNLPHFFGKIHPKYKTPAISTIASGIIMLVMALSLDLTGLAIAASVMFLFLFAQVNYAAITIRRLYGKKLDYSFKTPFFPIIPTLGILSAIGLSVYLLFTEPVSWVIAIIWIVSGFIIYKSYTSKKEIEHYAPLVYNQGPKERKEYRVLIIYHPKYVTNYYKIANSIIQEKQGEISFLSVVKIPVHLPLDATNKVAESEIEEFNELKQQIPQSIRHRYLVRVSHDETDAILSTVEEQGINLVIIDFAFLRNNRKLLSLSTCDFIGVRLGANFEQDLANLVVSYDKGRHSDLGLRVAHAISRAHSSRIRIVRGVVEKPETEIEIMNRINEIMFDLDIKKIQFEKVYPKTKNVAPILLESFSKIQDETIILGAGNQADSAFSPKTLEVVDKTKKSLFVIRDHQFSEFHARRFWRIISSRMRENRHLYKIYVDLAHLGYSIKEKRAHRYDEEYFDSKLK
ncbi:amino acid permease [Candidatus Nitrosotenuis aquarius]|uniref:amino acid permease n=1 Tax=Candidatus Nitrosotenuis aquarius TaxID=1846278 RepID=UPI000C1E4311|nr:amino acid permease [Candidatus Nitrosotenuis aquarius]